MKSHFNDSALTGLGFPAVVGNTCGIDFSQDAIFLPVLYGIFFIIGTPLNLLALFGLYRLIQSENVLPVYVINLLIADLIQLLTFPLWMDYYANGHHWRFGPQSCQFMGLFFYISIYAGIFFMCIIALERHLAIARPLSFQHLRNLRFARWIALSIWILIAVPPAIAFDKLFPKQENYTLCIEKYPSEGSFITYRLITLLVSFIIPLSFIVGLHRETVRSLMAINSLLSEEKRSIRGLLTLLVAVFVTVLGPYHFIGCVKYVGLLIHSSPCVWEKAVFVPYQVGRGFLSLNSLLDPVFYIFLRRDFRAAAGKYLPCLRRVRNRSYRTEKATSSTLDCD
ncbi:G- coupled receptor 4-like protein [Labeo rohita]|uniref:G-protein coupled receptor 4 n=2 Tax=Labeo rohita TaxID=84645 RepID=A0ABQ8M534_LABRO|nr:G-protein coupled receptor 4 [Labeo rohita]XP_050982480.1 G-protein coupled receptor 4 [Labeo rohita]XP_050982481.1 G-protein coupled receptor 4 [Labeo rohita]XP_050982482.1 G-protein coupled receptor 4 [Labeo rohita]KAI2658011.1 G-protein coupled receptor 4 [Labeo rohita]RXN10512.1 G- coupled receptor 4-like protein [Labeo rohita]